MSLCLCRLLVITDGMLVFRQDGTNTIRASRAAVTAGSDVSSSNLGLLLSASVLYQVSCSFLVFCQIFCASSGLFICYCVFVVFLCCQPLGVSSHLGHHICSLDCLNSGVTGRSGESLVFRQWCTGSSLA